MGQGKLDLTIIILAGNEQDVIADCLKSADFAKEIILVAANSSDSTVEISKKQIPSIKIISTSDEYGRNFAKWRNLGLKNASNNWILYLDADERITDALKNELAEIITKPSCSYYVIPRHNYYLGKRVKYGGSYPDYVKRLFQKTSLKCWNGILHEEPQISGLFGYLSSPLLHFTHKSLTSMLQKTIIWTDMEAKALLDSNHPPVAWWRIIRMMLTKLWQRLIIQQMWRDGIIGWISAFFETFDTFIIYARLWELQQQNKCQK